MTVPGFEHPLLQLRDLATLFARHFGRWCFFRVADFVVFTDPAVFGTRLVIPLSVRLRVRGRTETAGEEITGIIDTFTGNFSREKSHALESSAQNRGRGCQQALPITVGSLN